MKMRGLALLVRVKDVVLRLHWRLLDGTTPTASRLQQEIPTGETGLNGHFAQQQSVGENVSNGSFSTGSARPRHVGYASNNDQTGNAPGWSRSVTS
jgi:hypothetical protein